MAKVTKCHQPDYNFKIRTSILYIYTYITFFFLLNNGARLSVPNKLTDCALI